MRVRDLKRLLDDYDNECIVDIKNNAIYLTDYPEELKVEGRYYFELYINSDGGVWQDGCGNAPDGKFCGQCSYFDCSRCDWKERK